MLSNTNVYNVYLETEIYDNSCFFDRLISHVELILYYAMHPIHRILPYACQGMSIASLL